MPPPADRRQIACFARGTLIRTVAGDRPVETLAPVDLVPTACGRGDAEVRWVGRRRVRCDRFAQPEAVHPVRIAAAAFGGGLPLRDLYLSPHHAVLVDNVLIPMRLLLNGGSIRQEAVDSVEYWHVELDRHDILLAEGLPAESWLDCGNRSMFENTDCVSLRFDESRPASWTKLACAPLVTRGPLLRAVRQRLGSFITVQVEQDGVLDLPVPASCQGVRLLSPGGVLGGAWLDGEALGEASFAAGITLPLHSDGRLLDEDAFICIPPGRRGRALRLELILEARREA